MADTHVGEVAAELPRAVLDALAGCALVVHAGDITDLVVLRTLEEVAPVLAVQGDHDRAAGIDLPRARVIQVAGRRIALTHGNRRKRLELLLGIASLVSGRVVLGGLHRSLARRFRGVDCIVHGHIHLPFERRIGRTLVVSPGAVYVAEADPGRGGRLRDALHLRVRRRLDPEALLPAVGLLDVGPAGVAYRRVVLELDPPALR